MEQSYLESLNDEQRDAAVTLQGPVLIIAGAGTGKTHTLTARVMYMLNSGIEGRHILLVTFTNKAAEEMKDRIKKETGAAAEEITACTFHSLCAKFLRTYIIRLQATSIWQALLDSPAPEEVPKGDFRILSGVEEKDIIDILRKEWLTGVNQKRTKKGLKKITAKDTLSSSELMDLYSRYANEDVVRFKKLGTFLRDEFMSRDTVEEAQEILEAYIQYKTKRNMLDYDDLMMFTWVILASCSNIRDRMEEHYSYVMCDEYQDTNTIQDAILDLLTKKNRNLCVVGDDNQSIYRFRGARIENILSFPKRFPECHTVKLIQNYRSTQEILDVSNTMMHHAAEGILKDLIGQTHGEVPDVVCVDDDEDAAKRIVADIEEAHYSGAPYRDFGILERQGRQSAELEALLNRHKIPYQKYGGIKFFELKIVRDLLAYLQVMANPKDELAYLRIAKQYPELGNKRGSEFAEKAVVQSYEELRKQYGSKYVYHRSVRQILDRMEHLKNLPYDDLMPYLYQVYGKQQRELIENGASLNKKELLLELEKGLENAAPLLDMAKKFRSCAAFVESIALDQIDTEEADDCVAISTIHSAKGLEYEQVYILNASEYFYSRNGEGSEEDREDLRVLYVALTRAKKLLHIFINRDAPAYCETEQALTHHLSHEDVLEHVEYDEDVPLINDRDIFGSDDEQQVNNGFGRKRFA